MYLYNRKVMRSLEIPQEPGSPERPGRSRRVSSRQVDPHPRLAEIVLRHLAEPWRAPVHEPTRAAFEQLVRLLDQAGPRPLVLDSGCGDGHGTRRLGSLHPGCWVIGVDRSAARLARGCHPAGPHMEGNCFWLRAEIASFWRLAAQAGWRLRRHYLLYPNPWPKPGQLMRRWHAHPAFPALLALGGVVELRCNWRPYAAEFAQALGLAERRAPLVEAWSGDPPLTSFEAKYRNSGHDLFRVITSSGCRHKKSPGCPGL